MEENDLLIMYRSNRNFNIPPLPRVFDYFLCPRSGEFDAKAFPGWGKLNRKCQVSSDCFFPAPKSLTAINTCLDEMEEFKGRDRSFVSDWLTKKVFKNCEVFLRHVWKTESA